MAIPKTQTGNRRIRMEKPGILIKLEAKTKSQNLWKLEY